jgi:hypothetical protein
VACWRKSFPAFWVMNHFSPVSQSVIQRESERNKVQVCRATDRVSECVKKTGIPTLHAIFSFFIYFFLFVTTVIIQHYCCEWMNEWMNELAEKKLSLLISVNFIARFSWIYWIKEDFCHPHISYCIYRAICRNKKIIYVLTQVTWFYKINCYDA